jgi:hypothetical protein
MNRPYRVLWYEGGKPRRESFATREAADRRAQKLKDEHGLTRQEVYVFRLMR